MRRKTNIFKMKRLRCIEVKIYDFSANLQPNLMFMPVAVAYLGGGGGALGHAPPPFGRKSKTPYTVS